MRNHKKRFLNCADVEAANFEAAEVFDTRGLRLNSTYIRNARFSPAASDPWSVLRRKYTGVMFALNLLLTTVFLIPHFADALMWRAVAQTQQIAVDVKHTVEEITEEAVRNGNNAASVVRQARLKLQLRECITATHCIEWPLWKILLGIHRGRSYWMLAVVLLLYNASRAILTVNVGLLRDQEERSGYSPAWRNYWWLHWIHRGIMQPLIVLVMAYLTWHVGLLLFGTSAFLPI